MTNDNKREESCEMTWNEVSKLNLIYITSQEGNISIEIMWTCSKETTFQEPESWKRNLTNLIQLLALSCQRVVQYGIERKFRRRDERLTQAQHPFYGRCNAACNVVICLLCWYSPRKQTFARMYRRLLLSSYLSLSFLGKIAKLFWNEYHFERVVEKITTEAIIEFVILHSITAYCRSLFHRKYKLNANDNKSGNWPEQIKQFGRFLTYCFLLGSGSWTFITFVNPFSVSSRAGNFQNHWIFSTVSAKFCVS